MGLELSRIPRTAPVDLSDTIFAINARLEAQEMLRVKRQQIDGIPTGIKRGIILDSRLQDWAVACICKHGSYSPEWIGTQLATAANPWTWLLQRLPEGAILALYFRLIEKEEQASC